MLGSLPLPQDTRFDVIVGALEDLVLSEEFRDRHETFCMSHCGEFSVFSFLELAPTRAKCADKFSARGEYGLECTSIFQAFQAETEQALNEGLQQRLDWFDMDDFMGLVSERGEELHSDVFDVLMTMSEFEEFADLMTSFHDEKHGIGPVGDVSAALSVTSLAAASQHAVENAAASERESPASHK